MVATNTADITCIDHTVYYHFIFLLKTPLPVARTLVIHVKPQLRQNNIPRKDAFYSKKNEKVLDEGTRISCGKAAK